MFSILSTQTNEGAGCERCSVSANAVFIAKAPQVFMNRLAMVYFSLTKNDKITTSIMVPLRKLLMEEDEIDLGQ